MFFEVIPRVLGCSIYLKITQKFLLRQLMFLDYLSTCCHYGVIDVSAYICQKQPPGFFYENAVFRNFTKFTGKHLCETLFFNKSAGLTPATSLKRRLCHRCFLVSVKKFLRTLFLQNPSGLLPLLCVNSATWCDIAQHFFLFWSKRVNKELGLKLLKRLATECLVQRSQL